MYDLTLIRDRLAAYDPETFVVGDDTRQAAVALLLREDEATRQTHILFIKRAERSGDPWSGHMAFPGGHLDPEDADLRHAAIRETMEEIGLDLTRASYLGSLDQQRAMPRGRPLKMLIAPHVFQLHDEPGFELNHEVAEVVWSRLTPLARGEVHDTETKLMAGKPTIFNGYRLERGHFVWGMTYRMLQSFFTALDPAWQPPPEIE